MYVGVEYHMINIQIKSFDIVKHMLWILIGHSTEHHNKCFSVRKNHKLSQHMRFLYPATR